MTVEFSIFVFVLSVIAKYFCQNLRVLGRYASCYQPPPLQTEY